MMDLTIAAETPLDRVIKDAGSAMDTLFLAGFIALCVVGALAALDYVDRRNIQGALGKIKDALAPATPPSPATVEFLRALHPHTETFFRRSRAVVALGVAAVLFVAGGLVSLFETALVANHCAGKVAGATAEPGTEESSTTALDGGSIVPTADSLVNVAQGNPNRGNKAGGGRDGQGRGGGDSSGGSSRVGKSKKQAAPKISYPPGCEDED